MSLLPRMAWYVRTSTPSTRYKMMRHAVPKTRSSSDIYSCNEPLFTCQASEIVKRRPTIAAARCRLPSLMSFLGSRIRSTWLRLVFSRMAILFLEIFFFFMASASCHATTSFTACTCASSKILLLEEVVDAGTHMLLAHFSISLLAASIAPGAGLFQSLGAPAPPDLSATPLPACCQPH